jgi:histidinol-phosphate/aromatic aminotransferase/cobyric acid decarboxylase-like protein
VSFPLADWVLGHADAPHNLAISGMKDSLRTLPRALRTVKPPDVEALKARLARLHGVRPERVFLTHGATEANALVLLYLARTARTRAARPRLFTPVVEYPPIRDAAVEVGFRLSSSPEEADAIALSSPRNPLGTRVPIDEIRAQTDRGRPVLVDQTFREFSEDPAATRAGLSNLWLTGSFTKVYGADDLRVGYGIPPDDRVEPFARLHGLLLDRVPPASVSGALAILAHRSEILGEARGILRANTRYLKGHVEGVADLVSPVWFDRGAGGWNGDRIARRMLKAGVLVCPGSYFGDPSGVRLTLTRRSFPDDLDAYLRLRPDR